VSHENVELVEAALDAWNMRNVRAFTDHMAEDVVWIEVAGRPEGPLTERHGRDRLRRGLESLLEAWESYHLDVERVLDAGDRVLAIVREIARGRASGVEVDGRWGYLITVQDGEIARVEAYRDADRALEVAGLGGSENAA
jgi:ketosteroid isomerase-like protein